MICSREVLTASGRSKPGLFWESEIGDNIFVGADTIKERELNALIQASSATAWSFQEAPRRYVSQ